MDLILDIGISQNRCVLLKNEKVINIYVEDSSDVSIAGNIYKGRVENIEKSLKCAFVNIGEKKCGILHFEDCLYEIKKGDEILVQVTRQPSKNKGPRLSMNISIPCKNIVLLANSSDINISKKITNKSKRKELFNLGKSIIENNIGIIFRTECENISKEEILEEYQSVKDIWNNISNKWQYIKGEGVLYTSSGFMNYIKREFINHFIEKIYVNREKVKQDILSYVNENKLNINVSTPLEGIEKLNFLKSSIEEALGRKFLTSFGGNIIVDETEALNIIDVNSSSLNSKSGDDFEKLNINAIDEISKVILLKNLSGIILIDFINMKEESSKKVVKDKIEESFVNYGIKARVHDFTELGILEISRAKKQKSLKDTIYPNGHNKSLAYTLKNLENDLVILLNKKGKNSLNINVSYELYDFIEKINFIEEMKKVYNINLTIEKLRDFKDYYILEDKESSFARISIGNKNVIGKIESIIDEEKSLSIKINKID